MTSKYNTIFLAALAALLLLPSCERKENPVEAASGIRFAAPLQTKATDAVNTADVFQVRDWYNGASYHINNTLRWNGTESKWGYGTAANYEWAGGNHLFFSWLDHNESYSTAAFFGTGLSASGNTLTIPAKTLSTSAHQYDFMYSNPVSRATVNNDYSDVPLVFNHLFAQVAMSFRLSDETPSNEEPIRLYGAYLNNRFKNIKSAVITFNDDGTADVVFTDETDPDPDNAVPFSARTDFGGMSYGKDEITGATPVPIDMLSQQQTNTKDFYYFWPATEAELDEVIDIVYQMTGETDPVTGDPLIRTSRLSFPKGTNWKGGHKYSYTVTYMGGIFKVEESVKDWNYTELSASAEEQSAMASWIGWDSATCSISGRNISFKTDPQGRLMTIHGMFKIYSPSLCTYHINLSQNVNYYSFVHNSTDTSTGSIGTSAGDIHPGVTIDFYISADDDDRPAAGQPPITADLSFSVQATGGRDFSLDSELQRDGAYTIIIPSM